MDASNYLEGHRPTIKVQLKDSRIYELLHKLGLSYQRAHRDYANANPKAQKEWVKTIKKTSIAIGE